MYRSSYYDICVDIPQSLPKDLSNNNLVFEQIFSDKKILSNMFNIIEKGVSKISIGYKFENQNTYEGRIYTVNHIISIVNDMVNNNQLEYNNNVKEFYKLTSFENYMKKELKNKSMFNVIIEGKNHCIDDYDILRTFCNNENYNKVFNKLDYICLKYNLDYDELAYVMLQYAEKNKIFDKFYFNDDDARFFKQIKNNEIFDTSYINKVPITRDQYLDQTVLNQELVDYILKGMPKKYSLLEKSIYIYIKLCKTLTYDAEFFAHKQKGKKAAIHEDITRLSQITPENNEIVCYEFSQIYGKFLDELGIKFENSNNYGYYGLAHTSILYKIEKFLVEADSVTNIIGGDLYYAKVHEDLVGLKLKSENENSLEEFSKIYEKVYKDIKKQEPLYKQQLSKDLLKAYRNLSTSVKISFEDKIDILEEKLRLSEFKSIDLITFIEKNLKDIAQSEFKNNQINVCICNKKVGATYDDIMPTIIIEYSDNSEFDKYTKYYEFNSSKGLFDVHNQPEIQKSFNSEDYLYLGSCSQRLKGIQNEYKTFYTI